MTAPCKRSGILAYVYRNRLGPCGGISDTVDEIVIVGADLDEVFPALSNRPAFELIQHVRGCVSLRPLDRPSARVANGPMFGGNYANTSDSRLGQAVKKLLGHTFYGAIAIHDRFEALPPHLRADREG